MKIHELYNLYEEKIASEPKDIKKEVYALFDQNIVLQHISSDRIIYILRNLIDACSYDEDGILRMDYGYWEIATFIAMVSSLTDIAFPDDQEQEGSGEDEQKDSVFVASYDLLKKMRIEEYIAKKCPDGYGKFVLLKESEEKTFEKSTDINAVLGKSVLHVANKLSGLIDVLSIAIENMDPSKIEDAQNLLNHMNDSVNKISEFVPRTENTEA